MKLKGKRRCFSLTIFLIRRSITVLRRENVHKTQESLKRLQKKNLYRSPDALRFLPNHIWHISIDGNMYYNIHISLNHERNRRYLFRNCAHKIMRNVWKISKPLYRYIFVLSQIFLRRRYLNLHKRKLLLIKQSYFGIN